MQNHPSDSTQQSPRNRLIQNVYFQFIVFGIIIALLPLVVRGSTLSILGSVIIYSVAGLGFNLLLGYSGQISLGTAGFMGMATYITVYLIQDLTLPLIPAVILAVLIPLFFGVLVGILALRIAGSLLAIATFCVSEILRKSFEELSSITGGFSGRTLRFTTIFGLEMTRERTFVFLTIVLVLVLMLTYNLVNSQTGRAFHAMRGSEAAAQAMGIRLIKYRLISFSLATAYAALSGSLYMLFIRFSYPNIWVLNVSLYILAAVVIGGMRSLWGTILGAFIVFGVPDLVLKRLPLIGSIDGLAYIFNGILIIVVILFFPNGLASLFTSLRRKIQIFTRSRIKGGVENG